MFASGHFGSNAGYRIFYTFWKCLTFFSTKKLRFSLLSFLLQGWFCKDSDDPDTTVPVTSLGTDLIWVTAKVSDLSIFDLTGFKLKLKSKRNGRKQG